MESGGTVSSCANGHPVSPGAEYCGSCGEDIRPRCYQGHRSAPGARFCESCGALLAAGPSAASADVAAAELVTEYTTGSFSAILAEDVWDAEEPAGAGWLSASPLAAEPTTEPIKQTYGNEGPPTRTGVEASGVGDPDVGHRRKRPRAPIAALGVAVLVAAAIAGGFTLLHHRPGRLAQASAGASRRAAATASASPARSRTPAPAAAPATWTAPTPLDQQAAQIGNPTITGVSCPQATVCFAVDSVGAIMSSTAGGGWRTVATDSRSGLAAISCAATTFCLALDSGGGAITLNQGSWSSPVLVDSRVGVPTAASCPTPTFCMAVDSGGSAFAYTGSATGWQAFTVDPSGTGLTSVSCTSASYCVAVGETGDVFSYNGSSWSAGQAVDNGSAFGGVSCSSPVFCMGVDRNGMAAVFADGKWTISAIGVVADAIACPSDGSCVAVDGSGGALVYRSGRWSPVTDIDGGNAIEAVSCPVVDSCTATDSMGNVMYYSSSPAAG